MGKYNYGMPYGIEKLSKEEKIAAIKEFAEGSLVLEECLLTAVSLGLLTTNCCRGHHEIEEPSKFVMNYLFKNDLDVMSLSRCMCPAYISFDKSSDIVSYLSSDLINNPNVRITKNENDYCIYFYGAQSERLMRLFTQDMKTGKKNHKEDLDNKINKNLDPNVYYASFIYAFKNSGFNDEDILPFRVIFGLNACRFLKTYGEIHNFCVEQGLSSEEEDVILKEKNIEREHKL